MPEPWERQENESPQSFGAFAEYRDMGADRSIPKVAQKCTKNESLIKRWSAANGWVKRAEAWDNEQDRLTREKLTKGVTGMRKKYVDICAAATLKIAQALKNVNIERNSFKDITAALKIIMEIERINRGEPAEITEIAGERNFGEPKFSIRRKTDYSRLSDEEVERLYEIAEKLNST